MAMARGYVYVERAHLGSVLQHGYLSMRAQYEVFGKLDLRRYVQQYAAAFRQYPDLRRRVRRLKTFEDQLLAYLDWRASDDDEEVEGSRAVYALYVPIPPDRDIRDFIAQHRDDWVDGRVLISFPVPEDAIVPIDGYVPPEKRSSRSFWRRVWRNITSTPQRGDELWLEGVPHFFFVPPGGVVAPEHITVIE